MMMFLYGVFMVLAVALAFVAGALFGHWYYQNCDFEVRLQNIEERELFLPFDWELPKK